MFERVGFVSHLNDTMMSIYETTYRVTFLRTPWLIRERSSHCLDSQGREGGSTRPMAHLYLSGSSLDPPRPIFHIVFVFRSATTV